MLENNYHQQLYQKKVIGSIGEMGGEQKASRQAKHLKRGEKDGSVTD